MNATGQSLSTEQLLRGGFSRSGEWARTEFNSLVLIGDLPVQAGVYAFSISGIVHYIGVASRSLKKRISFYVRPGSSQSTNLRLNALILTSVQCGNTVEVFTATPPDMEWNGWKISAAEGLEAGLIRTFHLPWNSRGSIGMAPIAGIPEMNATDLALSPNAVDAVNCVERTHFSGKYGPLREYLRASAKENISLTFAQIENLVGKLPKSASLHQAWWGNHEGNVQAKSWMEAGYLVEVNRAGRSVTFRKFSY